MSTVALTNVVDENSWSIDTAFIDATRSKKPLCELLEQLSNLQSGLKTVLQEEYTVHQVEPCTHLSTMSSENKPPNRRIFNLAELSNQSHNYTVPTKVSEDEFHYLRRQKDRLQRENRELTDQVEQLQSQLNNKNKQIQTLLNEVTAAQDQLEVSENAREKLEVQIREMGQTKKELDYELHVANQEKTKLETRIQEMEKSRDTTQRKLLQSKNEHEAYVDRNKTERQRLEQKLSKQRDQNDRLVMQLGEMRKLTEQRSLQLDQNRNTLVHKKRDDELEELRKQLMDVLLTNKQQAEFAEAHTIKLEQSVAELQAIVKRLEEDKINGMQEQENTSTKNPVSILERKLRDKEEASAVIEFQYQVLNDQLVDAENEKRQLIEKLETEKKIIYSKYQQKIRMLVLRTRTTLAGARRHRHYLHRRLAYMTATRTQLKRQVSDHKIQLQHLNNFLYEFSFQRGTRKRDTPPTLPNTFTEGNKDTQTDDQYQFNQDAKHSTAVDPKAESQYQSLLQELDVTRSALDQLLQLMDHYVDGTDGSWTIPRKGYRFSDSTAEEKLQARLQEFKQISSLVRQQFRHLSENDKPQTVFEDDCSHPTLSARTKQLRSLLTRMAVESSKDVPANNSRGDENSIQHLSQRLARLFIKMDERITEPKCDIPHRVKKRMEGAAHPVSIQLQGT